MKKTSIILFVMFLVAVAAQNVIVHNLNQRQHSPTNYTIVLSIDGFRADYPTLAVTPALDSIEHQGVKAKSFAPSFPTVTFTNHYGMATGLYAEKHGIVANKFMHRGLKQFYNYTDTNSVLNSKFYKGEPIWVTAEAQKVHTASYFWVGSEVSVKGYKPSITKKFDGSVPYVNRIDSITAWLQLPVKQRPRLVMCYIEDVDNIGHTYGTSGPEIVSAISRADSLINRLRNNIAALSFSDSVNLIIVSDHGMANLDTVSRIVNLNQYLPAHLVDTVSYSDAFSMVYCKKNCTDSVVAAFNGVEGIKAIARNNMPANYHFSANEHCIGDVILLADSAWCMSYNNLPMRAGAHGFAPENNLMNGIFYAVGPDFKQGYEAPQLQNIDLYALLCRLLHISLAQTDSDLSRINCVLKQ